MRRNVKQLERAAEAARSSSEQALACFQLAVFHDNNGREREAIPYYRQALKLGLPQKAKAQASAWLASSLYKVGAKASARKQAEIALRLARGPLRLFVIRLQRRIGHRGPGAR